MTWLHDSCHWSHALLGFQIFFFIFSFSWGELPLLTYLSFTVCLHILCGWYLFVLIKHLLKSKHTSYMLPWYFNLTENMWV